MSAEREGGTGRILASDESAEREREIGGGWGGGGTGGISASHESKQREEQEKF